MPLFTINPDITQAATISKEFYTSPAVFDASREKIFARSWQFAGDSSKLAEAGAAHPFTLLEHYLNEPLVLTKDKNDQLHCLSNVCTHRGNLLVTEPCKASQLRCRYHGRLFGLDGKFQSMPEFRDVKNFPTPADDLRQVPLYQWGKLLFVCLEHGIAPELFFGEMISRIAWLPLEALVPYPGLSKQYRIKAHWALYCENYLEGFHIPFVHAGLNAVLDFSSYTTELFRYSSLQVGVGKKDEACFNIPASSPDYGRSIAAYYFWVFPNMMFNFYPWGLSLNIVKPVNEAETIIDFLTYVYDASKLEQGAGSGLDTVELEDEVVVEQVQQGIRSRFYSHGRYAPQREQGTHHFHSLLAEFMQ